MNRTEILFVDCVRVCVLRWWAGHNWGSPHDPTECAPSADDGGKHLMYWVSVSGQDANNNVRFTSAAYLVMGLRRTLYDVGLFKPHYQLYEIMTVLNIWLAACLQVFSPCSRRAISNILQARAEDCLKGKKRSSLNPIHQLLTTVCLSVCLSVSNMAQ